MRFRSLLATVALATLTGACSEGQIATEVPTGAASGGAVLLGTVVNSRATSSGITVSVVGTSSVTATDAAGKFVLGGLPEGAVTLRLKGVECDAAVEVSGLANGRSVTIQVNVAGSQASLGG
jgi:hypothetical protein